MALSEQDPLLSLSQAAERLGVHPATLRRWADKGEVRVVVTPGGHRRFPQSEVERLIQQATSGGADLGEQWASKALSHTRAELAEHRDDAWMATLDEADRAEKREMGRRLMGLMMQYIAGEADEGAALLDEARVLGTVYAESSRRSGMTLTEALEATMFFRDNIVESAVVLPETARRRPEANKRLLRRINTFLNAIQLAIAEAYNAPGPDALPGANP